MKNKLLSILLAFCCAAALLPTAALAAEDASGTPTWRTIIAPQYDDALPFQNGLGCVWKDGKCGFVDKTGEVISPQYRYFFTHFSENGLAAVCNMNGKYGFIDAAGNTVIPFEYDIVEPFHDGLAIVGEKRTDAVDTYVGSKYRWGFINEKNHLTWFDVDNPDEVDNFTYFQDGYASMMTRWKPDHSDKAYLFDREGKQVPISYEATDVATGEVKTIDPDMIVPVGHGLFFVTLWDMWDSARYYNPTTGEFFHVQHGPDEICYILDEENFEDFGLIGVTLVDTEYATNPELEDSPWPEKLGFIDASGQWVIPPTSEHSYTFWVLAATEDDIFVARADQDGEGSKWGVMNKANEVVLPVQYEGIGTPAHGLLPIKENGKWGFMNAAGEMAIPAQYMGVTSFNEDGLAAVSADGQTVFLIDTTGAEIPSALDGASVPAMQFFGTSLSKDVIASDPPGDVIIIEKDGKYGYAMLDGGTETPDPTPNTPPVTPSVPTTPSGQRPPAGADKEPDKEQPPVPVEEIFADVNSGDWYRDAVQYVHDKGLMTGVTGTTFAPGATVSRAMLVTVLYRLAGEPAVSSGSGFRDVPSGAWYADAAAWAAQNGIAGGYGGGSFCPDDPSTREQFVVMLLRYAKTKQLNVTSSADLSGYADCGEISPWALEAVQWANAAGLMTGRTGTALAPGGTATRGEAAALIMRFCETVL